VTQHLSLIMFSHLFIPVISRPTRYSNNNSTLIDNIIVNSLSDNCMSDILLSDISYHLPIFQIYNDNIAASDGLTVSSIRSINERNINDFNQSLGAVNWNSLNRPTNGDVDEYFNMFRDQFYDLFNACISVKHVKKKQRGISQPWITPGILKSIHKNIDYIKNLLRHRYIPTIGPCK